ncbi:hypothetical protein ACIREE_42460 [Streptomyces sp. NPDC102467]
MPDFDAGPSSGGDETQWVVPATFLDQLGDVLRSVPAQNAETAL